MTTPTLTFAGTDAAELFTRECAGTRTFTNLHILLAQDVITTLTTGQFYPGPYDTVYFNPSVTLTSTVDGWMGITLDHPFPYDPTKSLIMFVGQCGTTGSGMSVRNTTLTPVRRTWSVGGCPFVPFGTGGDGAMINFGVVVVPATSVEPPSQEIPVAYGLVQNYPNPFNPTTTIKYAVPVQSEVTLKVYSVLGQEVATLAAGQQGPGTFCVSPPREEQNALGFSTARRTQMNTSKEAQILNRL